MAGANRYSLARYSLGSEQNVIKCEATFAAELKAVCGAAVPVPSDAFFGCNLWLDTRGTAAVRSAFEASAELGADAEIRANIRGAAKLAAALGQSVRGSKDCRGTAQLSGTLAAAVRASKNLKQDWTFSGDLRGASYGSKNIRCGQLLSGVLTALAGAVTQETDVASISIAIPPGAELRIDSDTYTVTLNGANILYAQLGDWVKVSRGLLRLDIESASGGMLEGALIYTERYL